MVRRLTLLDRERWGTRRRRPAEPPASTALRSVGIFVPVLRSGSSAPDPRIRIDSRWATDLGADGLATLIACHPVAPAMLAEEDQ